jgi:hypothetical protein
MTTEKFLTHNDGGTTIRIGGANVEMTYATMLAIVDEPDEFVTRLRALLTDAGVDLERGRITVQA